MMFSPDNPAPAGLHVVDAGMSTTVQDLGRPGHREHGVPPGGAFDRGSAGLANALAGNDPGCAVLELTLSGGMYEARSDLPLAMAGASIEAKVVGTDGTERTIEPPLSFTLHRGERLVLGRTLAGARTYLAVAGGWQTPVRLGSRSSEERLRSGDLLPAAAGSIPTRHPRDRAPIDPAAEPLRILDGPEGAAINQGSRPTPTWLERAHRVGAHSDRMGLRLEGIPPAIDALPDRLSAPVAPGAIQAASGGLIVLGVACGTMGGYPHVAHVISADLDRLGQLRPGDLVRFARVDLDEARRLDRAMRVTREATLNRIRTAARDRGAEFPRPAPRPETRC
ncbi:MAG: 5-oxoprolinase subunit C family protein [Isosphaeraceae bacterium]